MIKNRNLPEYGADFFPVRRSLFSKYKGDMSFSRGWIEIRKPSRTKARIFVNTYIQK